MNMDVHFSSVNTERGTPEWLFENLDDLFQFDLDAAANEHNYKCAKWFGPGSPHGEDAFEQEWTGTVWLNPPYGRGVRKWVEKAYDSAENGATVVCLLPARTDTKWFQVCWRAAFVVFITGRLRFEGTEASAPFPSCLVVFGHNLPSILDISLLSGEGTIVRAMWQHSPIDKLRYEWLKECRERQERDNEATP